MGLGLDCWLAWKISGLREKGLLLSIFIKDGLFCFCLWGREVREIAYLSLGAGEKGLWGGDGKAGRPFLTQTGATLR